MKANSENIKYIFFVTTVGSISKAVLPLIEKIKNKEEILIIAATEEAELFFKNYTDFNTKRMKVNPNLITRKTKHKIFENIIRSKIEYKKLFRDIKNCEIYFFGHSFSLVIFSYVRKLSKNNKVFHWGGPLSEKSPNQYPVENSFRAYSMKWIAKWLMGVEIAIRNRRGVPFWSIDEKFYKNRNIKIIDDTFVKNKSVEKYMIKLDILKGKKILIAIEDSIKAGTIEETEFINKMDQVMDIFNDVALGQYVIKPHPRLNRLYGKMSHCKEIIPSYIPFEFVLNHNWKVVIGIDSESLISAAKQTKACVISLINLFTYISVESQNNWRNYLQGDFENKIRLPKDLLEFKQLLKKEL